uniref:Uncharacterized protein n=1 Tax=Arundo donax TaxID=35708 RepID=A0A0A9EB90_ARUDO
MAVLLGFYLCIQGKFCFFFNHFCF